LNHAVSNYFPIASASEMFDGKEVFLVSGSNTHSIPTAMFTMANMMKGVVGFTFLP